MPLVELAHEIVKAESEPVYFRDLMETIKKLRGMSDDEVTEVIARLYTEINLDGRFVCVGQNMWGLKRWYPVDKGADRASNSKRFVRRPSGDAFSDDDDADSDYDEDDTDAAVDGDEELLPLDVVDGDDAEEEEEDELAIDEEEEEEDVDEDFDEDEEDADGDLVGDEDAESSDEDEDEEY